MTPVGSMQRASQPNVLIVVYGEQAEEESNTFVEDFLKVESGSLCYLRDS